MKEHQITYDPIYNTVDRDDFDSLIEVDRYANRTDAFDEIIAATVDHFWDPTDPRYIDYEQPFDITEQLILPRQMCVELQCAVADKLDEGQKIRLANQNTRFILSSILHGEQGALSLSASLTMILRDPGAVEYAANQAREEARHVAGFSNYISKRWGTPLPAGQTLQSLLTEIVVSQQVYKKLIGMQMLIEGLAMGAFASMHELSQEPLLKQLVHGVMRDESRHVAFGVLSLRGYYEDMPANELSDREDFIIYACELMRDRLVGAQLAEAMGWNEEEVRQEVLQSEIGRMFRTMLFMRIVPNLKKLGLITPRVRAAFERLEIIQFEDADPEAQDKALGFI